MLREILAKNLYKADYFGRNINFLYNGSHKIQTFFGGFLSIVTILLGVLLFGYFSIDLFQRKTPITRLSQEMRNFSEINIIDFPIMIGFATAEGLPFGEEIYSLLTVHSFVYYFTNDEGKTKTEAGRAVLEKCDPDIHLVNHKEIFSDPVSYTGLNEMCVNPTKSNITKTGYVSFYNEFGTMPSAFIDFVIKKCNEERDNKKCADENTFKSLAREMYIVVQTIDYYIDLQDLTSPNKKKLTQNVQMIGYQQPKRSFYRYKKVSINTDDGFLMEANNNVIDFYQFSNVKLDFFQSDDYFYEFSFEVQHINDIFYRRYDKIQDVLARVGGIFKILSFLGQLMINYYCKYVFYFDITNKFFEKATEVDGDKFNVRQSQNVHLITIKQNNSNQPIKVPSLAVSYINNKPLKKEILTLNFGDYLKSKICSERSKYPSSIYKLSQVIMENNLNILTYLKKLKNVDQLIDVITNTEEEKSIFNVKQDLEKFCQENFEFMTQKENYNEIILQIKKRNG